MRANIEIVERRDDRLVIRDRGPWDRHMTITNDAEGVVDYLLTHGWLTPGMRLFYYDSEDRLDELMHDGTAFTGFKLLGPSHVLPS